MTALVDAPEYATAAARLANRDTLNAEIERHTVTASSADWVERLNKAGVPCGPIYAIDKMFADPQVEHLAIAKSVVNTDGKTIHVVGQPFSLSRTPSHIDVAPPKLGEHTDEVLGEFGFSAQEIAALRQANAI
jgi:formyl-CoA transferase